MVVHGAISRRGPMLFYYYMFDVVVFSSTSSDRASSVEEVGQRRRHGTWRQVGLHHRGRLLLLLLYRLAVVCSSREEALGQFLVHGKAAKERAFARGADEQHCEEPLLSFFYLECSKEPSTSSLIDVVRSNCTFLFEATTIKQPHTEASASAF